MVNFPVTFDNVERCFIVGFNDGGFVVTEGLFENGNIFGSLGPLFFSVCLVLLGVCGIVLILEFLQSFGFLLLFLLFFQPLGFELLIHLSLQLFFPFSFLLLLKPFLFLLLLG